MPLTGTAAVAVAAALDRAAGEPPDAAHPVAWFGRLVAPFDRTWPTPRAVGVAVAVLLPLLAAGVAWGVVRTAALAHPAVAAISAGGVLFVATSLRMLLSEARAVVRTSDGDPTAARERLPALAGRDPADLTPGHLRSAAVESAAENLADGLVAPLLAFAVLAPFSLPLAAAGAAWVKAVNTLDSMLGYRSKPVGWASARLDDLVMWLPARASAVLLAVAAANPDALLNARRWARAPPSPNSGWPMGTVASALQIRLEKPGAYDLNAMATLPDAAVAERGVALVGRAGLLTYAVAGVVAWA